MPKMLIADDHAAITDILVAFAEAEGYETAVASDGEETMRLFRTQEFDVVLLDVMMPKKDGFTVCREIRAKLEAKPHPDWQIKTVWGVGYAFEVTSFPRQYIS